MTNSSRHTSTTCQPPHTTKFHTQMNHINDHCNYNLSAIVGKCNNLCTNYIAIKTDTCPYNGDPPVIRKKTFWPQTHTKLNCTLCLNNNNITWLHLLSLCNNKFLGPWECTAEWNRPPIHRPCQIKHAHMPLQIHHDGNRNDNPQDNTTIHPTIKSKLRMQHHMMEMPSNLNAHIVYINGVVPK